MLTNGQRKEMEILDDMVYKIYYGKESNAFEPGGTEAMTKQEVESRWAAVCNISLATTKRNAFETELAGCWMSTTER